MNHETRTALRRGRKDALVFGIKGSLRGLLRPGGRVESDRFNYLPLARRC
jgi:hypothetical protein